MCGIVGFFERHKRYGDSRLIWKMNEIQGHRGPDDSGVCGVSLEKGIVGEVKPGEAAGRDVFPAAGFMGFCRLSVLDPSLNGHQPMLDKTGQVALTFNGEVYNAFDFQEELEADGYAFRSHTDTEVILALYLKYGVREMARKLNGMFAISLLDMREKKLYLIRDRYGIKPLYYAMQSGCFLYASEIKALMAHDSFAAEIDEDAYRECAVFGYPYGRTLVKGVREVVLGTILEYDLVCGELKTERYFDINEYFHPVRNAPVRRETGKKLKAALNTAVKRQLLSDVALGCQLSGGIDSSLTGYFAAKNHPGRLDGVSVIYGDAYKEYSEEKYMNHAAGRLGLRVHKAELSSGYYTANLCKMIWHLDTIPKFYNETGIMLLAQKAKQYVTVLLSGEGSDELLCGYDWMKHFNMVALADKKGAFYKKALERLGGYGHYFKGRSHTWENFMLFAADAVPVQICEKLIYGYREEDIVKNRVKRLHELAGSPFDRQVKYEMEVRLPALFNRQDKATMSAAVENRVPFMDNDFVEFTFTLPERYVLHRGPGGKREGKFCLKKLCAGIFGTEFAFREKSGFPVPVMEFLQEEAFRALMKESILPNMKARGILNAGYVSHLYQKGVQCSYWETYAMFMAVCLELWAEMFIDRIPLDAMLLQRAHK